MPINHDFFFDMVRSNPFGGGLRQEQVEGTEAILKEWEDNHAAKDDRWLAYMLATAFHETARTMQPVRETLSNTDDEVIRKLDRAWAKGQLSWVKSAYWRKDGNGDAWYGRGLVQLTHRTNYERMARLLNNSALVTKPDTALQMPVAISVMFEGMEGGMFTGRKLSDYFKGSTADWVNARRIINGLDRADDVAAYARAFYAAISYTVADVAA